jgi:hypothetical protein
VTTNDNKVVVVFSLFRNDGMVRRWERIFSGQATSSESERKKTFDVRDQSLKIL